MYRLARQRGVALLVVMALLVVQAVYAVDAAVVVVENIFRHMGKGKDRRRAALDATHQVTAPVIASRV